MYCILLLVLSVVQESQSTQTLSQILSSATHEFAQTHTEPETEQIKQGCNALLIETRTFANESGLQIFPLDGFGGATLSPPENRMNELIEAYIQFEAEQLSELLKSLPEKNKIEFQQLVERQKLKAVGVVNYLRLCDPERTLNAASLKRLDTKLKTAYISFEANFTREFQQAFASVLATLPTSTVNKLENTLGIKLDQIPQFCAERSMTPRDLFDYIGLLEGAASDLPHSTPVIETLVEPFDRTHSDGTGDFVYRQLIATILFRDYDPSFNPSVDQLIALLSQGERTDRQQFLTKLLVQWKGGNFQYDQSIASALLFQFSVAETKISFPQLDDSPSTIYVTCWNRRDPLANKALIHSDGLKRLAYSLSNELSRTQKTQLALPSSTLESVLLDLQKAELNQKVFLNCGIAKFFSVPEVSSQFGMNTEAANSLLRTSLDESLRLRQYYEMELSNLFQSGLAQEPQLLDKICARTGMSGSEVYKFLSNQKLRGLSTSVLTRHTIFLTMNSFFAYPFVRP